MTSGFSGLPKLRQLVTPIGCAPEAARLRAASATALTVPTYGSRRQRRLLQSSVIATAFCVPSSRTTAASEPGRTTVLPPTYVSYWRYTHSRDERFGDSSSCSSTWL